MQNETLQRAPFGRADLFHSVRNFGSGNPPVFTLQPGLTALQRALAFDIVCRAYPVIGYGTTLRGDEILTFRAD
jgi:hypothetical protein